MASVVLRENTKLSDDVCSKDEFIFVGMNCTAKVFKVCSNYFYTLYDLKGKALFPSYTYFKSKKECLKDLKLCIFGEVDRKKLKGIKNIN